MTSDVLDRLRHADPVAPGDPALDPDSPQARALLLRARAVPAPPRRRTLRVRGAAAAGLAAGGLALVALGGGSPSPVSARATVLAAADRTAAFDSGRLTRTSSIALGEYRAEATTILRFDGTRTEMVSRTREILPGGGISGPAYTTRSVGGRTYLRDDTSPGSGFRDVGPGLDAGQVAARERAAATNDELIALVREAEGVERVIDAAGEPAYRAKVALAAVQRVQPPTVLTPPPSAREPDAEATLALTLTPEGTIRRLEVERPGATEFVEWSQLGEPQPIEAP